MTRFGFVLGRSAATAPELQGWQPGDEFEAARNGTSDEKSEKGFLWNFWQKISS